MLKNLSKEYLKNIKIPRSQEPRENVIRFRPYNRDKLVFKSWRKPFKNVFNPFVIMKIEEKELHFV